MKTISSIGIDFLDDIEGRRNHEYPDVEGNPTIGIGHLLTRSELTSGKILVGGRYVKYREGLTEADIDMLFAEDLDPVETVINTLVHVELSQYQFDTLCSFVFNVGIGAFAGSALLKLLNQGFYAEVPHQLRRWIKARNQDGKLVDCKGLKLRRDQEITLWNNRWRTKY